MAESTCQACLMISNFYFFDMDFVIMDFNGLC